MIDETLKYLSDLVAFKSISPASAGSIEYLEEFLRSRGFQTQILSLGEGEEKTDNLYARLGNKSPNICFAGHTDVVPPGDLKLWHKDPFTLYKNKDRIYGRGVVDMKGALACMMAATEKFLSKHSNFDGSISFLITSDEEASAKFGTKELLKYMDKQEPMPDITILGEPASSIKIGDQLKIGRRGSINFILEVSGVQGHVAYPEKCTNPLHILNKILGDILAYEFPASKYFDASCVQVTSIDTGNAATNVVPQSCKAKFNIRFNEVLSSDKIISIIETIASKYSKDYSLERRISAEAFVQEENKYFKSILDITGKVASVDSRYSTTGGTSDARFIHKYCPVIEVGLLNETAHKINEHTEINHLQKLAFIYYTVLCDLLAS